MLPFIARLPLLVTVTGLSALLMLVPAAHAVAIGAPWVAGTFALYALLTMLLALMFAIALAGRERSDRPRRHLVGLLVIFVVLPLVLAVPFQQAVRNTTFLNAYVEMVSSLTTTGATLFPEPGRLPQSVHLWRATVGWLGGLFMWVSAIAVLAPMALGGFEVRARRIATTGAQITQIEKVADLSSRVRTYAIKLFPVYTGLTATLWLGLILAGETPFIAICHAMSTLSTSGISPVGGVAGGSAGYGGEVMVAIFLIFAVSRLAFSREGQGSEVTGFLHDSEVRLALFFVATVPLFLFLRHFFGAYEVASDMTLLSGLASLWGSVFTVFSFLTTTGFVSAAWESSQAWSGLSTPGLILMGLALVGGGVATTAGGAKLLRVWALYQHGRRELDKLVHPNSVAGSGSEARHIRRGGAYMAWVFFMLMTLSVAVVMMAFSFTGENFEQSVVLTVAALTTTGPLADVAASEPIRFGTMSVSAKLVLSAAMVLGRLELLAIVALLSPNVWRPRGRQILP
ncbi:potassium transporter TrkG [Maritimibacter sp. UBA3975]|uniref:TrkH family potassium uptake protein n=1 Tax=Maritimibacter sp. UBA3975 TaxID=1946833 RepID=UPI000C0BAB17|nr:potassium transporter TrkG [Maritimibacter sp. UBA3975]MAM60165.1 potassium transporter TrkH [Maritimibacter sp.]|tara:strand:+ start:16572 stop:18110 length:1539 start_codon:yes stop_codon:yes gene_type:complete